MSAPAAVPRLHWAERPHGMKCACGREPICGFLDEGEKIFWCSVCWDDGLTEPFKPFRGYYKGTPHFRTPEERQRLLRGTKL